VPKSDTHAKWLKAHLSQRAGSSCRAISSSQREEKEKCECLNYISCTDTVGLHTEGKPSSMPSYFNSPASMCFFRSAYGEGIWNPIAPEDYS